MFGLIGVSGEGCVLAVAVTAVAVGGFFLVLVLLYSAPLMISGCIAAVSSMQYCCRCH